MPGGAAAKRLAALIEQAMTEQGLTQTEVAERISTSLGRRYDRREVSRRLRNPGARPMVRNLNEVQAYADALGLDVTELMREAFCPDAN